MHNKIRFSFMRYKNSALYLSIILILLSIISLMIKGLNLGLDFTGGALFEVQLEKKVDIEVIRAQLEEEAFIGALVQPLNTTRDLLIRIPISRSESDKRLQITDTVVDLIKVHDSKADFKRIDFIGPAIGSELRDKGGIAMIIAILLIMIYIMLRFTGKFAVAAVIALFHDTIITLGVFSFFELTFDLSVLSAILAIIGYSLNDTIVISDRIRENFKSIVKKVEAYEIIDLSLNQMLERTILTSFTTLLVLISLITLGGKSVFGFSLALIFGVVIGTYSSIYVVSNILLITKLDREDFIAVQAEKEEEKEGHEALR